MSAHVLLILLNKLGKRVKMRGLPSLNVIFYLSYGIKNASGVKTSYFCHFVRNVVMEVYFKYF